MPLVDSEITEAVQSGELEIESFAPECVQPASYDLRIGPLMYSGSEERPDRPINLSSNGGAYRIPPYGNVLLMTFETLRLPLTIVGRFGLTSSFTRKNLHASTGPQVDPGYYGKLFITLLNLTPKSHVVRYQEKFLSIEFNRLDKPPDHPYQGQYQGRTDIGPEILEDLVRFEGLNLSQMQSQFTELTQHVKEWSQLALRFNDFLQSMERHTEAIQRLVTEIPMRRSAAVERLHDQGVSVEARSISTEEAMGEILKHFNKKKKFYYSDIIEKLNLSLATVVEACNRLREAGHIDFDSKD